MTEQSMSTSETRALGKHALRRVPALVIRLAMGLAIGWACWSTVRAVTCLNRPLHPLQHAVARADTEPLSPPPSRLAVEGVWTLGDLSWRLAVGGVVQRDLEQALDTLPSGANGASELYLPSSLSQALSGVLDRHGAIVSQRDGYYVTDVRSAELRIRLFRRHRDGKDLCCAAYCAVPRHGDQWTLVTVLPSALDAGAATIGPLLPYTKCGRRVASRRGGSGSPECEVVALQVPVGTFLEYCRCQGWTVERSSGAPGNALAVCRKGVRGCQVRFIPGRSGDAQALVLIISGPNVRQPLGDRMG